MSQCGCALFALFFLRMWRKPNEMINQIISNQLKMPYQSIKAWALKMWSVFHRAWFLHVKCSVCCNCTELLTRRYYPLPSWERLKALVSHIAHCEKNHCQGLLSASDKTSVLFTLCMWMCKPARKSYRVCVYTCMCVCVCVCWCSECMVDGASAFTKLASAHHSNVQVKLAAMIWVMPTITE